MVFQFFSNPIIMTVFLTAAVGICIYEVIEEKRRQNRMRIGYLPSASPTPFPRRRTPSPRRRSPSPPRNTKTVRQRKPGLHDPKREEKTLNEKIRNSDYHTKNYEKNVVNKIRNDTENINKNLQVETKMFEKDITNENSLNTAHGSYMSVKENPGNKRECCLNVTASSSDFADKAYKEDVLNKIRNDVSLCRGCEYKISSAVFYPCGHCYLCSECAMSLFRIYGKCTVCEEDIVRFENRAASMTNELN